MFLDSDATFFTFQTFDDDSDRKDPKLVQVLNGTLEKHLPTLAELNRKGAGIFVTINETDGEGRKAENIVRVRHLFVDLDGAPLEPEVHADYLWDQWKEWCMRSGNNIGSRSWLGRNLRSAVPGLRTVDRYTHGAREQFYVGIEVLDDEPSSSRDDLPF